MPGYDKSRIVGLSADEMDEYTCGICQDIINNPMFTQCCRQTYCRGCINEWLTSQNTCPFDRKKLSTKELLPPPRLVINLVNNIKIKCEYHENGCTIEIKIGELTRHQEECKHRPGQFCGLEKEVKIHDCIVNHNIVIKNKSILDEMAQLRYEISQLEQNNTEDLNDLVVSARRSLDNYVIEDEDEISSEERRELIKTCKEGLLRRYGGSVATRILNEIEKNVKLRRTEYWHVFVAKNGLHSFDIMSDKYFKIVFNENLTITIFTPEKHGMLHQIKIK